MSSIEEAAVASTMAEQREVVMEPVNKTMHQELVSGLLLQPCLNFCNPSLYNLHLCTMYYWKVKLYMFEMLKYWHAGGIEYC